MWIVYFFIIYLGISAFASSAYVQHKLANWARSNCDMFSFSNKLCILQNKYSLFLQSIMAVTVELRSLSLCYWICWMFAYNWAFLHYYIGKEYMGWSNDGTYLMYLVTPGPLRRSAIFRRSLTSEIERHGAFENSKVKKKGVNVCSFLSCLLSTISQT
jgi:hypothetical protein